MRPIIEPPATTRCQHCGGELRLKAVEDTNPTLGCDVEVLVCVGCGCGCEQAITVHKPDHK